ncbi:MAG: 6-phosphogluconolactonase [Tepidisphaeraceae bacterium]
MTAAEIKVLPDPPAVAAEAAERIVRAANEAIALSGKFTIALAGGSTPKALFELLASPAHRDRIDWRNVEVFFGDERTVPPDHADSNYRMARDTLLSKVPIPADHIHRMRGEIDPEEAAKEYGQILKEKFPSTSSGQAGEGEGGGLDLILLGMGDDGHTASLFPGTPALRETKHRAVANPVPKLNTTRLTMTAPFINRAREVLLTVTGANKASRLSEVLEGSPDPERLPVQLISPTSGKLSWLVDAPAAGMTAER